MRFWPSIKTGSIVPQAATLSTLRIRNLCFHCEYRNLRKLAACATSKLLQSSFQDDQCHVVNWCGFSDKFGQSLFDFVSKSGYLRIAILLGDFYQTRVAEFFVFFIYAFS